MEARIAATLALLSALASPAAAQQFEITPVMSFSVPLTLPFPAPTPPTPVWINGPASYVIALEVNDSGQVGFGVGFESLGDGEYERYGVYRRAGTTIELMAFSGDPLPDGSGRTLDRVDLIAIETSGDVIVLGRSCGGLSPGSPDCTYGIYRATGSGLSTIVQSGQSLPDSATDTLGSIYDVDAADGQIAFATTRKPSQLEAVYRWSAGALTRIALEAAPAWAGINFGWVQVNSSGTVSFIEYFDVYNNLGVFVSENGVLRTVASTGAPAPNGGTFDYVFAIDMDEAGNVALETWLLLPNGLCCDSVILADSGGSMRTVVDGGQTAPGTQVPFGLPRRPAIHDGRVAFWATFHPNGGADQIVTATYAEVDGGIARVVLDGQPAPEGLPGRLGWGSPRYAANGDVLFFAFYGYAVDPSFDSPIGLFRARFAPEVPALGAPAQLLVAALLAFSGARAARRASGRSARSAPSRARAGCGGAGRRAVA
jgi:hypothetical protein